MSAVPTAGAQLAALMRLTWKRATRGTAMWVCLFIGLAPVLVGAALRTRPQAFGVAAGAELITLTLISPVLVSGSIGDEIDDRTATYLWSRPLPRWVMVVAKLLALAPIAALFVVIGWNLAVAIGTHDLPPLRSTLAFAVGACAIATMAVGIATLVPKYGMALSIGYIVLLDSSIGLVPASLNVISMTRQIRILSGLDTFGEEPAIFAPLIAMVAIAGVWLAIGLWRVRKLEV